MVKKENSGKMKILLVTSKFPRFENDPQPPFVYYLALEYVKLGHEVHVLAPHDFGAKQHEIFHDIHVHRFAYFLPKKTQKVAYGPGIPDNLANSHLAKVQMPFFVLAQIAATRSLVKKIKPDVVHAHWAFPQGFAALLCGKKYFVTFYGGEVFMSKKYHMIGIVNRIIKKSAKSFSITKGLRKVMFGFGIEGDIGVIPLGADLEKFKPGIIGADKIKKKYCKKEELMILSVGRLVEKKGHIYLIDAFAKVLKTIPNSKLVIVGDGPLYDLLFEKVKKLGISKNVIFTKEINHSELPKYYCAADIFVLPSIIDKINNMETQGVVFVEAMACKCPVIGTDTGGIPDVIPNDKVGFLAKEKNADDLAQKMLKLLKNEKLRKEIGNNGYIRAKKVFSWKKIAAQYIEEYKKYS